VAAALRLFRLGRPSLWVDEILTWYSIQDVLPSERTLLHENVHGPLYSALLHAWVRVAGDGEWALRFPSVVFGVLLVPATAWLASRWLGRATAVPAAWLAATAPFLVWYGQEARNYALLMLCVAVSGALLLGMRRRLQPVGIAGYAATAAAGLLSNFSFAFLGPLHFAWWLGEPGRRGRRLAIAGGMAALLAIVALPWLASVRGTWDWSRLAPGHTAGGPELRQGSTFHPAAVPWALHALAGGYTLGPPLRALRSERSLHAIAPYAGEIALVVVVFGALGVLGLAAVRRRGRLVEALLWLAVPIAILSWFAIRNFKVFHPRYLAVVMPGLVAVWAAGLADLGPRARRAFVVAIALVWGLSLVHLWFDPAHEKDDLRSAARTIAARGRPGETVIAANTAGMLFYYYRGPLAVRSYWLGYASDSTRLAAHFEVMQGDSGSWVLLARPEDLDPRGAFARWVDAHHPNAERYAFPGVRLWHLGPASRVPPRPEAPAQVRPAVRVGE